MREAFLHSPRTATVTFTVMSTATITMIMGMNTGTTTRSSGPKRLASALSLLPLRPFGFGVGSLIPLSASYAS